MKDLSDLIFLSQISIVIPIVSWIVLVRKPGISLYFIFFSILLSALFDGLQYLFAVKSGNNSLITNLYPLPSLVVIYLAFYLHKDFTHSMKRVIGFTGLAVLSGIIYNMFTHDLKNEWITFNQVLLSIAFILLSLYYFIHKIFYTKEFDILKHPLFYISCAIFIYNLSSLTIFSTYNLLIDESFDALWGLKLVFYMLYNLLLSVSFFIFRKYKIYL